MPKVSVILPTYNRLSYLQSAYRSVKAQSFQDYEICIIDDASTDDTRLWLQEAAEKDPQIRCIFNSSNLGVSRSRNLGIFSSSSPWVALLDSDDRWAPNKLALQLEFAKQSPHCPLLHTEEIWIRNGVRVNAMKKHQKRGGWIFEHGFDLCRISPSASLIQRELFETVGGFREDFPVCEDYELWLRITRHHPVGFLPQPLTIKFGGHNDQLSRRYHSMDYWRVKALAPFLKDETLSYEIRQKLSEALIKKCRILLRGYEKHQNFKNYQEVQEFLQAAQNRLEELNLKVLP